MAALRHRVAQADPIPESVTDRPTNAYEMVFLLAKRPTYFYDAEAVREPLTGGAHAGYHKGSHYKTSGMQGEVRARAFDESHTPTAANARNVWTIPTQGVSQLKPEHDLVRLSSSQAQGLASGGNGCGDDICRIPSLDCPEHERQPDWAAMGFCDGLQLSQVTGIFGNGHGLESASTAVGLDSEPTHDPDRNPPYRQGSLSLEDFRSAIGNSTESHKTGRVPSSSQRAKSSDQTPSHTEHTEPEPSEQTSNHCGSDGCKTGGMYLPFAFRARNGCWQFSHCIVGGFLVLILYILPESAYRRNIRCHVTGSMDVFLRRAAPTPTSRPTRTNWPAAASWQAQAKRASAGSAARRGLAGG